MKISLVIPYLESDPGKPEILQRFLDSCKGQYDELIVVDSKTDSLAKKINTGLKKAKGDFIVVSNDDVIMRDGILSDLCFEGEVDVPVVHGGLDKLFHGHMWCIPKEIRDKIGYYDESCPSNYYIDSDYWVRLFNANIPIVKNCQVHINHPEPGRTLKHCNNGTGEGRDWFIKKHGSEALRIVE